MKLRHFLNLVWFLTVVSALSITGKPCHPSCSNEKGGGWCQSGGRCLCWWGWTGPNAEYIPNIHNRIQADYCSIPCHYTHDFKNTSCAASPTRIPTTLTGSTSPVKSNIPRTAVAVTTVSSCNPNCTVRGHGACKSDGRCLCWWGWTGPHAVYILSGRFKNRILADYCFTACHYTPFHLNPSCAKIPVPPLCKVPPKPIDPPKACNPRCITGVLGSRCLSNGRCLCWWGWTGPNSCYVVGNKTLTNRILADWCNAACHYTHDYRNDSCVTNTTGRLAVLSATIETRVLKTKAAITTESSSGITGSVSSIATHVLEANAAVTTESRKPQDPNILPAAGDKIALMGEISQEEKNKDRGPGRTEKNATVAVPLIAAFLAIVLAAIFVWGYKRQKRRKQVEPKPINYSNSSDEIEPILKTFHYNN